jgi:hypothetical protein
MPRATNELEPKSALPRTFAVITAIALLLMDVAPAVAVAFAFLVPAIRRPAWWVPWTWGLTLLAAITLFAALDFQQQLLDRLAILFLCYMSVGLVLLFRVERAAAGEREPRHCHAITRKGDLCRRPPLRGADYCYTHRHLAAESSPNGRASTLA